MTESEKRQPPPAGDGNEENWRKYGTKVLRKVHPSRIRDYYKCAIPGCPAKKYVDGLQSAQLSERQVSYHGEHRHDAGPPCSSGLLLASKPTSSSKPTTSSQPQLPAPLTTQQAASALSSLFSGSVEPRSSTPMNQGSCVIAGLEEYQLMGPVSVHQRARHIPSLPSILTPRLKFERIDHQVALPSSSQKCANIPIHFPLVSSFKSSDGLSRPGKQMPDFDTSFCQRAELQKSLNMLQAGMKRSRSDDDTLVQHEKGKLRL